MNSGSLRRCPAVKVVGDFGVGKTSLIMALAVQRNSGSHLRSSMVVQVSKELQVTLCDTDGMEEHRSVTQSYYRHCNCLLLVADPSDTRSISNLDYWRRDCDNYASDAVKILVFTKSDQHNPDQYSSELRCCQERHKCLYAVSVSAHTGNGLDQLRQKISLACDEQTEIENKRIIKRINSPTIQLTSRLDASRPKEFNKSKKQRGKQRRFFGSCFG